LFVLGTVACVSPSNEEFRFFDPSTRRSLCGHPWAPLQRPAGCAPPAGSSRDAVRRLLPIIPISRPGLLCWSHRLLVPSVESRVIGTLEQKKAPTNVRARSTRSKPLLKSAGLPMKFFQRSPPFQRKVRVPNAAKPFQKSHLILVGQTRVCRTTSGTRTICAAFGNSFWDRRSEDVSRLGLTTPSRIQTKWFLLWPLGCRYRSVHRVPCPPAQQPAQA
jgi:hypothetical protein